MQKAKVTVVMTCPNRAAIEHVVNELAQCLLREPEIELSVKREVQGE